MIVYFSIFQDMARLYFFNFFFLKYFFVLINQFRQVVDTSGDEDDGMDETILPVDYNKAGVCIKEI